MKKKTLEDKFREIRGKHYETIKEKTAKVVLGPSVIRALRKGTKTPLQKELSRVNIKNLITWSKDRVSFEKYFLKESRNIEKIISSIHGSKSVNAHAHAAKILALYCRDLILNSLSCNLIKLSTYNRLERLLFCPIDGIVIDALREIEGGKELLSGVKSMKDMKKSDFMKIQNWLMAAAKKTKVPCVWFDDVWV